jgi:hypothetical protein
MCLSFIAPHLTVNNTGGGDGEKSAVIATLDVCNAAKTLIPVAEMPSICPMSFEYTVSISADYFIPDSQHIASALFTFTKDQPPKSV